MKTHFKDVDAFGNMSMHVKDVDAF